EVAHPTRPPTLVVCEAIPHRGAETRCHGAPLHEPTTANGPSVCQLAIHPPARVDTPARTAGLRSERCRNRGESRVPKCARLQRLQHATAQLQTAATSARPIRTGGSESPEHG